MKSNLIAQAEAAPLAAKPNRSDATMDKSAVDKARLASANEGTLDKPYPSKPPRRASKAHAPSNEAVLYILLEAPDCLCDSRWRMRPKVYPNLVHLSLTHYPEFQVLRISNRLTYQTSFVVPVEPWGDHLAHERKNTPLVIPCCQFLAVSVRGDVPMPVYVPSQIIEGGFNGVLKTIETMWPNARRVLDSERLATPPGWLSSDFLVPGRR